MIATAKFVFKLQSLLNLKEQIEENVKNELGKAIQRLEHEKNILNQIETEREKQINIVVEEAAKGVPVGKLKDYSYYIKSFNKRIELQKQNINGAEEKVDKCRRELVKAMQERKMLENLKEKKYQEFMKEYYKKEQSAVDERVSFNYSSNEK